MQKVLTTTRSKQFTLLIFTTTCILTDKLVGTTSLLKTGINDYYTLNLLAPELFF